MVQHLGQPASARILRVPAFVAVACLLILSLLAAVSGSAIAAGAPSLRAVKVDRVLAQQLAANPSGGVAATVTAWNLRDLDQIQQIAGGTKMRALPMVLTKSLTLAQLDALKSSPAVRSVWANTKYRLLMEETTWTARARYTWSRSSQAGGVAGLGITGKNVHVAVIDTGADGGHEDMDNLVEFCETQQALTSDHTSVSCSPFNLASGNLGPAGPTNTSRGDATDDNGHGSHVSGTIAGTGDASGGRDKRHSTMGLAPNAKLHVYSANIGPSLAAHEILSAYDDMINKKLERLSTVVAVNNSWGGGGGASYNPDSPQSVAFKRAYDAGILSVFAAGNSGAEHNTLSAQCISPWVVCVAASTKPDAVVMFSSRGRPSERADTNRDGVVGGSGDIAPDNHDRKLAQAYDLGVYRPTLSAPGVNINSINANEDGTSPLCREILAPLFPRTPESADARDCYVQFNGTSMATPHVTGSVPLIVEAYRKGHGGATPTPAIITEILERSANLHKLPGYEAEEQGSGRLDVYDAAKLAGTYPSGMPRPNFGTPSPAYQTGLHPGAPATSSTFTGCTGTLSWSAPNPPPLVVDVPPVSTSRYGQHFIDVPQKAERLRVTVRWPGHPAANLYVRLWRPGVNPSAELPLGGQTRVFPDQEGIGLTDTNAILNTRRWLDIRAPEESGPGAAPPTIPSGRWVMRVYHRAGGAPATCGETQENPKQTEGFRYQVTVELPQSQLAPTVNITSPAANSTLSSRWVTISGTAGYPAPWDGVTNYEVPGSGNPAAGPEGPDTRTVLHFHGNVGMHASGEPAEASCTGNGAADILACDGPFLIPEPSGANLSPSSAASWFIANPLVNGGNSRTIHDPNWVWNLSATTTVSGSMTVVWWGSCAACDADLGLDADWRIRLYKDNDTTPSFEQRITATPSAPNTAEKLEETVNLPAITASSRFVLHVDPVYIDTQNNTRIYYDSTAACPTAAAGSGPCDSLVRMPVGAAGSSGPDTPTSVRVTDMHSGMRVAWESTGASGYEIHRSQNPAFAPGPSTRIATTPGTACDSPNVPTWPTASDSGLCYTDGGAALLTTYYYRVVAVNGSVKSKASLLAYGARTQFDRQVKLKVDRLYGPQYWEYALLDSAAATQWTFLWDTVELLGGAHPFSARSFTQGIGSARATRAVNLGGNGDRPPPPPDPDDDPDDDGDDNGDGNEDDDREDDDD
jgi:subtilisin family serine protease